MTGWRKVNGIYQPVYTPQLSRRRAGLGGRPWASGRIGGRFTDAAVTGTPYLSITTQPAGAVSGDAFTTQPVIQLKNADGSNRELASVTVTAAIASGAGSLSGTTTADTNASGVATFSNLAITGSGTHTLTFTATGYTAVTSGGFGVSDGSLYFESTWSTTTGTSDSAVYDGGKFDYITGGNTPTVLTVRAADDLRGNTAWTGDGNVLEAAQRENDFGIGLTDLPLATTHHGRIYIMWGAGFDNTFRNDHGACDYDYVGTIDVVLLSQKASGATYQLGIHIRPWSEEAWGPVIAFNTWYRYEWKIEYVDSTNIKVWPRLYNMAGTLLADSDDYVQDFGDRLTLTEAYAVGGVTLPDGAAELQEWGIGDSKTGTLAGYLYYADVAFSLTDWVGA